MRLGTGIVCFGQEHGLNFQKLLDASAYKEAYRRDMILWGEAQRRADPGFFCRKVVEGVCQPVWVRVPGVGGAPGWGAGVRGGGAALRKLRVAVLPFSE